MEQTNEALNPCAVCEEPVAVVPAKERRKFPIVSVILIGIAFVMAMVSLIGRFSFLKLTEIFCLAAIVAGMIVSKKEKDFLAGFGFIAFALMMMAFNIRNLYINLAMTSFDPATVAAQMLVLAIQSLVWLADIGIGITYLVGKPKLAGLKTACSIVAMSIGLFTMICSLAVMRGNGAASLIATFLLENVTLYIGAILYTPCKK